MLLISGEYSRQLLLLITPPPFENEILVNKLPVRGWIFLIVFKLILSSIIGEKTNKQKLYFKFYKTILNKSYIWVEYISKSMRWCRQTKLIQSYILEVTSLVALEIWDYLIVR